MPRTSSRQRRTTGRVMHEFKHGELKSGPRGKSGRAKSRRQAVAIALKEAGVSRNESERGNRRNRAGSKRKEAHGETAQQRKEGKRHVGASGKKASKVSRRGSTKTRRSAAKARSPSTRRASAGAKAPPPGSR